MFFCVWESLREEREKYLCVFEPRGLTPPPWPRRERTGAPPHWSLITAFVYRSKIRFTFTGLAAVLLFGRLQNGIITSLFLFLLFFSTPEINREAAESFCAACCIASFQKGVLSLSLFSENLFSLKNSPKIPPHRQAVGRVCHFRFLIAVERGL